MLCPLPSYAQDIRASGANVAIHLHTILRTIEMNHRPGHVAGRNGVNLHVIAYAKRTLEIQQLELRSKTGIGGARRAQPSLQYQGIVA